MRDGAQSKSSAKISDWEWRSGRRIVRIWDAVFDFTPEIRKEIRVVPEKRSRDSSAAGFRL
jgi:hypothetical protein